MRILVFDVPASRGGALSILKDFIAYIDKNVDVHEWYFVVSTGDLNVHNPKIHVIREGFSKRSWFHRVFWELFLTEKIVKQIKPDVILSLQNTAIMFTSVPQVVYIHQSLPFSKGIKLHSVQTYLKKIGLKFFIGKAVKKASMIVVQTEWMKKALIETYNIPNKKIVAIPPSVDVDKGKVQSTKKRKRREKFFYPAGPSVYKNFEAIVEAIKKLVSQGCSPKIYLTINGHENSYTRKIKNMSKPFGQYFEFLGFMPREEIFKLYQESVLIFPSFLETFGLPLLEARMYNIPIIASDRPFSREILKGYKKVSFFNPSSPEELASKMREFLDKDKEVCDKEIMESENQEFLKKYSPDNTWGKLLELLEKICR